MSIYKKKPDTFEARRWTPSTWQNEPGWPVIEPVWGTSPEVYGVIHTAEGDLVVECGGYVTPINGEGGYAVYAGQHFIENYERVPLNKTCCC